MTKQKIIDIVKKHIGLLDICFYEELADELFLEIEQELCEAMKIAKITSDRTQELALKEQATKIFNTIFDYDLAGDLGEFCGWGWIFDIDEAMMLANEFEVSL